MRFVFCWLVYYTQKYSLECIPIKFFEMDTVYVRGSVNSINEMLTLEAPLDCARIKTFHPKGCNNRKHRSRVDVENKASWLHLTHITLKLSRHTVPSQSGNCVHQRQMIPAALRDAADLLICMYSAWQCTCNQWINCKLVMDCQK